MSEYELLYIVPSQFADTEVAGVQKNVRGFIEKYGGKVLSEKNLGKIRLAYPIKKVSHGTYILAYFNAEPAGIKDLDRELTLHDEVLRHVIVSRPEGALEQTFEITSYVAPLSDEARAQKRDTRPVGSKSASAVSESIEDGAPLAPSATSTEEANMSMEELDKKIDEILDVEVA